MPLPREPEKALPLLERALTLGTVRTEQGESEEVRCAVVITFAEALLPPGDMSLLSPVDRFSIVRLQQWAASKQIAQAGGIIILTTRDLTQIHPDVRAASSKVAAVPVPLPDYTARLQYIRSLAALPDRPLQRAADCTEHALAAASAGLSLYQIEDVKLRAEAEGVPVDLALVRDRKNEVLRQEYHDVLEILEPQGGFDTIGGYEYVKTAFRRIVERMRRGVVHKLPKGILLLGPAGTGKTELAKALAKEAGVTCVRFNVGRCLGKYVGESEAKLDRALAGLVALPPCIAFVDELDQQTGRGEGAGSDVEKRVFARLLEIMGDPQFRGKVLWVAASNRPDLIDPAIKRSGRLDYKIPVLPPQEEERPAILAAQMRRYGADAALDLQQLAAMELQELVTRTEGWTGAELEKLVLKALEVADEEGVDRPLTLDHLRAALAVIRPSTKNIEFMTTLALAEVDDLTLVPARYRGLYENRAKNVDRAAEDVTQRGPRTL